MSSRDIKELHPKLKALAEQFLKKCKEAGIEVIITSTYRSIDEQNELYAQGRTKPGKIVTKVKGGDSFHNWRLAFDYVPIVNGKCIWNDNNLWDKCAEIALSLGLESGHRWLRFKDSPHIQYTQGLTIKDLKAGKTIK